MRRIDTRRLAPRVRLDGLCGVVSNNDLRHAALLDLSALGLRLERPFDPTTAARLVQLEIELPGTDEILWARAEVTFAHLSPMGGRRPDGQPRFWCRAGLRLSRLTHHDRRLLRDYVLETRRSRSCDQPRGSAATGAGATATATASATASAATR